MWPLWRVVAGFDLCGGCGRRHFSVAGALGPGGGGAFWSRGFEHGGNAAANVVSCWRAGDCAAGGFYTDVGGHQQAFVVTEHNGVWGDAEEVPGMAALNQATRPARPAPRSARCRVPLSGYCAAAGDYDSAGTQQVFVVSETNGGWGTAREVPGVGKLNVGGDAAVDAVSCPSAGNCGAGGYYQTPVAPGTAIGQDSQAFVVSESKGRWTKAEEVPGMQAVSPPPFQVNYVGSMSCRSAGYCTAAGIWNSRTSQRQAEILASPAASLSARCTAAGSVCCCPRTAAGTASCRARELATAWRQPP